MFNAFKEGEQIMDLVDEVRVQESGKLGSILESIDFFSGNDLGSTLVQLLTLVFFCILAW